MEIVLGLGLFIALLVAGAGSTVFAIWGLPLVRERMLLQNFPHVGIYGARFETTDPPFLDNQAGVELALQVFAIKVRQEHLHLDMQEITDAIGQLHFRWILVDDPARHYPYPGRGDMMVHGHYIDRVCTTAVLKDDVVENTAFLHEAAHGLCDLLDIDDTLDVKGDRSPMTLAVQASKKRLAIYADMSVSSLEGLARLFNEDVFDEELQA